ncbi:hypothetical protein CDO28_01665 [Sinorhizobium meliloti]|uniref:hypothetical protein n=1 Tax=Rhizobium meliloti TaxID=382 RepID=UPI000B49EB97|nr:hypothetical protein [Sinorhizobium meliloti]ASP70389.1 hypothetical protein CDO28_01665 [Sinorhizobium meliloti]MDE3854825.1 hypothetical protein [Sinorhizobium meliloti]MQW52502.1 hypothetical protein [Sinorhizobium meliloti]
MSISVGGVNLLDTALNTELRVMVLEKIIDRLIAVAPPGTLTQPMLDEIRKECVSSMKRKYPQAGIQSG